MHLSPCELFVSPPQALSCWVCSLKRLCFYCHPSPLLCVFLSLSVSHLHSFPPHIFFFFCCLHQSPSLLCPSVFHYRCFFIIVGEAKENVASLFHSQPFTSAQAMTLCYLRAKLVSAGSFENIIKLFMQQVWPLTISLLSEAGRGACVCQCVCVCERGERRQ